MNKETESSEFLESLKSRVKAALGSIEDIRYSLSEIEEELTDISELADSLSDLVNAEDE